MNSILQPQSNANFAESAEFKALLVELKQDADLRHKEGGAAPFKSVELLKKFKFGALRLPEYLGGRGLTIEALFQVLIEVSAIDSDIPQIFRSHFQFVEDLLRNNDQGFKDTWFEVIASGAMTGNAFTEINKVTVGNGEYNTRLTPDGDKFRLNGEKFFTTGTLYADYVSVRVGNDNGKAFNVIIPKSREGINVIDDWDGIGQRYTASGSTVFKDVEVFANEIIPVHREQVSFKPFTQLYLHAIIAGVVKAAERDATLALRKRGRSFSYATTELASQDPIFLEKIGEISAAAFTAEAIILKAARLQDIAFVSTVDGVTDYELSHEAALAATKAKIALEPIALDAATKIFDVVGASATRRSLDLDRHWRNIRTLSSHNPASLKAVAVGQLLVNERQLPNNPYF